MWQKLLSVKTPDGGGGGSSQISGGGGGNTIVNNTPSTSGYNKQSVNNSIVSRQTVIDNTTITKSRQSVLVVDDVTNKQMKGSRAEELSVI